MILPPLPAAQEIPVAKVQLNPDNHRQTYELDPMLESIRTVGLLQPPGVWFDAKRDCYHVIWGNQRTACMRRLEAVTMLARVFPGPLPPGVADRYQIIENVIRVDLLPSEEARGYRRILDGEGIMATELAAMISVSDSTISKKLSLLKLLLNCSLAWIAARYANRPATTGDGRSRDAGRDRRRAARPCIAVRVGYRRQPA